jgi:uncharacterized protein
LNQHHYSTVADARIVALTDTLTLLTWCEKSTELTCDIDGKEPTMKELVTYIARSLVDRPEQVSVVEVQGNQTTVLELTVAKEDLGKVIGKQGKTAQAMRTILEAVSSKIKRRMVLEIIE